MQGTLTKQECDVLTGMMIVFMHAAERCVQVLESHFENEYKRGADYNRLRKAYGKARADEIVAKTVTKILRGNERNNIGKLLETAQRFRHQMENLTDTAVQAHDERTTFVQMFDHLQHDANYLCHIYTYIINCTGANDELMIESTLKTLARGERCSEKITEIFN